MSSIDQRNQLALTQQISSFSVATIAAKPIYSRFFIIKSYTEEDVHKAIKYQLWSSTERGNKILDDAFLDLQNLKSKKDADSDLDRLGGSASYRRSAGVPLIQCKQVQAFLWSCKDGSTSQPQIGPRRPVEAARKMARLAQN